MSDLKFTEDHEWIKVDGDVGTIGITDYAQEQLGDIVFVDLPEAGKALSKGGDAAVVESVKTASDIFAPLDGEVTETNDALGDDPSLVNSDAQGAGWFFKMKIDEPGQLNEMMDEAAYKSFTEGLE